MNNLKMKRALICLVTACMVAFAFAQDSFPDVPANHWAYESLKQTKKDGLLVGYSAQASHKKAPDLDRTAAIWDAANERITTQLDVWFEDGDFLACIQLLKSQAELVPADYEVWTDLGWMEENCEEWDDALATYVRYHRQNPQDADSGLPEAFYYVRKKLWAKVPAILEPEIKRQCHPNNFRLLASSYEKQNMFADSIRVWKIYLSRDPNDGAAKMNLARVEKKLLGHTKSSTAPTGPRGS